MQRLNRRSALRLGALGAAIAMGRPLLVANAAAQTLTDAQPSWTLTADIPGCPKTSANIRSVEVGDLDIAGGTSKQAPLGAVICAIALAEVRAEIEAWFDSARKGGGAKTLKIVLTQADGGSRGFILNGAVPARISAPQASTSENLHCYVVDLLVDGIALL
jgi:hypothetical protein